MATYLIETPNPEYSGRAYGVPINGGKGILNEHMLDKSLGRDMDTVVRLLRKEFGYTVTPLEDNVQVAVEAALKPAGKTAKKAVANA